MDCIASNDRGLDSKLHSHVRMDRLFGQKFTLAFPGLKAPIGIDVQAATGLWAVEIALSAASSQSLFLRARR